jgi:predicted outer membrane repeat protein
MDNIEVRQSEMLNIDEGVTVLFQGPYFLKVSGCLKALGSIENPILFSIADTTGFYIDSTAAGGWKQIRIEDLDPAIDSTLLLYCHFAYGKAVDQDSIHGYGGAICVRNSTQVSIANCRFDHNYAYFNGGAVYLKNASIRIMGNAFENNRCGQADLYYGYGGGLCADSCAALIEQNYFSLNSSTGIGGGLCVRFSDCPLRHNIFEDNFSALGGGFGMLHIDTCRFVISNNLVFNNGALFFGSGISNGDCSPTYINNTIVNNNCIGGGGGFYCKDSVVPVLINNIIYGNTQYGGQANQVYLWDNLSQPDFYFNDIQGGTEDFAGTGGSDFRGEYENNIDQDPLFESNTFFPALNSPCVNAGSWDTTGMMVPALDLAGKTRIVEDTIDMGAYEQQTILGIVNHEVADIRFLHVYPNPAHFEVQIDFELLHSENISLFLSDMKGHCLQKICEKNMAAGNYKHFLDLKGYTPGTYLIVLKTSKASKTFRIIKK